MGYVAHVDPGHPVMGLTAEQYLALIQEQGVEEANALVRRLNKAIRLEKEDPFRGCYVPEHWRKVEAAMLENNFVTLFGGNRSMKSTFAAWKVCQVLVNGAPWVEERVRVERPVKIACFHSSSKSSIVQQQALIYRFLPQEWKDLGKRGKTAKVNYSVTGGFTEEILALPNGAICQFFNYKQDISVLEGYEFDMAWFDELVPADWLRTVDLRLSSRKGRMVVTFTPVNGYTPTVNMVVSGARVAETVPLDARVWADRVKPDGTAPVLVEGCPPGEVPWKLECRRPKAVAFYFLSEWNQYSPFNEVLERVLDEPMEQRLIRTCGWAEKTEGGVFGRYGEAHRVPKERWAEIATGPGTRVCVTDPGGRKNWFIKWYFINPQGHIILYREWPDYHRFGEWAVPDENGFKPGPAQKRGAGMGIVDIKRLILEEEGWVWDDVKGEWNGEKAERIDERYIDPRFGGSPVPSANEETSVIMLLADENVDPSGRVVAPSMEWTPAPLVGSRDGLTPEGVGLMLLKEKMRWDPEKPLTPFNCPSWYVVETCLQSDLAYREYTGENGLKDPLKDIIDPDRYLLNTDPSYHPPGSYAVTGGGAIY